MLDAIHITSQQCQSTEGNAKCQRIHNKLVLIINCYLSLFYHSFFAVWRLLLLCVAGWFYVVSAAAAAAAAV